MDGAFLFSAYNSSNFCFNFFTSIEIEKALTKLI